VPLITVLGITCGNTLEGIVGAHLLRIANFRISLDRVRDVLALVVLAAVGSTVIAATIGVPTWAGMSSGLHCSWPPRPTGRSMAFLVVRPRPSSWPGPSSG
jgi:integral membrane sensor domain MASE1